MNRDTDKEQNDQLTRLEALKKMGKYAGFTALGSFIILNPQQSQAQSPSPPDAGGDPFA